MTKVSSFLDVKYECLAITGKEFGENDNDGKDAATWKNRQTDWYNAERRFVFACKTTKERDKWVEKIVMEKIQSGIRTGIVTVMAQNLARNKKGEKREAILGLVGQVTRDLPGAEKVTTPGLGGSPLKKEQPTKKKSVSVQQKVVGSTGSSASPIPRVKSPPIKK